MRWTRNMPPYSDAGPVWRSELERQEQRLHAQLNRALEEHYQSGYADSTRWVVAYFAPRWLAARARLAQVALDEVIR